MKPYDIFLVGVGGQGLLTIGEIISESVAAMGAPVNFYPTKGMAQRGGFVKAQLRVGRENAGASVPERGADLVISTELSETLKAVRYVKPGSDVLIYGFVWAPTAVVLGKAPYPAQPDVIRHVVDVGGKPHYVAPELPLYQGEPIPDNVYVLGAALGYTRLSEIVDTASVEEILRNRWKRGAERNLFAFRSGLNLRIAEQAGAGRSADT
ncbi:MAG: 2-oxoacid:acceptor oxidoreductase family protein [Chloroflexi bacterium]|nr:2-oxoacid:acceptor oxidoreductase family protein [Chloroflexota bacterium]